jgi:hypothetical protein
MLEVAGDLHVDSPTFRQWLSAELDNESGRKRYILEGSRIAASLQHKLPPALDILPIRLSQRSSTIIKGPCSDPPSTGYLALVFRM